MKNVKNNNFISSFNHNEHINNNDIKKINREEFKRTWHITFFKILISLIGIFILAICSIVIYKTGKDLLNGNERVYVFGYIDFLVKEDNLSPIIEENDLIIVKKQDYYSEEDIILYTFAKTSMKIGKVEDKIKNEYIISDNNIKKGDYNSKISSELIIGKSVLTISNFKTIYNIITSPITIILLLIITISYFYLLSKGKLKERSII